MEVPADNSARFRGADEHARQAQRAHEEAQLRAQQQGRRAVIPYTPSDAVMDSGLVTYSDVGPPRALSPSDPGWHWPTEEEKLAEKARHARESEEPRVADRARATAIGVNEELVERLGPGALVEHFRGELCIVLEAWAAMEATLAPVVVYRSVQDGKVWVRDHAVFCEMVEHEGVQVPRFEYIGTLPSGIY